MRRSRQGPSRGIITACCVIQPIRVRRLAEEVERGEFDAGVYRRLGKEGKMNVILLNGIAKSRDKLVALLDMDRLLTVEDVGESAPAAA
jgi:hypothetical protein